MPLGSADHLPSVQLISEMKQRLIVLILLTISILLVYSPSGASSLTTGRRCKYHITGVNHLVENFRSDTSPLSHLLKFTLKQKRHFEESSKCLAGLNSCFRIRSRILRV